MADPTQMDPRSIATLKAVMAALRDKATGCPWDLQQSFETIAPYTIEEAYEVADAIERNSLRHRRRRAGQDQAPPPGRGGETTLRGAAAAHDRRRGRLHAEG